MGVSGKPPGISPFLGVGISITVSAGGRPYRPRMKSNMNQMAHLTGAAGSGGVVHINCPRGTRDSELMRCPSAYIQSIRDGARVYDALARGYGPCSSGTTGHHGALRGTTGHHGGSAKQRFSPQIEGTGRSKLRSAISWVVCDPWSWMVVVLVGGSAGARHDVSRRSWTRLLKEVSPAVLTIIGT